MKKYLRKNVPFDTANEEEMELYKWLQQQRHGYFSDEAKKYFRQLMNRANDPRVGVFNTKPEKMREDK